MREKVVQAKRWVVKVGSSLVTDDGQGLNRQLISQWSEQINQLRQQGIEIILVSSGSVAAGVRQLGWSARPSELHQVQVAAAVGQASLVGHYEEVFAKHDVITAQVLLTHADFQNRQRYLNARAAFRSMMDLGVLPVVNENDTVAIDEIRFGDNDRLAAMVANLVDADLLVLLTDQDGLFTTNPNVDSEAKLITEHSVESEKLMTYAGTEGGKLGTGGMLTKVKAAQIGAKTGVSTIIANGRKANILHEISDEDTGTLLYGESTAVVAKKQWLATQLHVKGTLVLDQGATKMLAQSGSSLLPVGVVKVEGNFQRGELVSCVNEQGKELARGLVNYSSEEAKKIAGKHSNKILDILGVISDPELIHRDNLALVNVT